MLKENFDQFVDAGFTITDTQDQTPINDWGKTPISLPAATATANRQESCFEGKTKHTISTTLPMRDW